ncbi:MAG: hypothetical protein J2P57_00905 [Acidimicrobiaceae bacterium]|nr:hypothetical protein [Acidimicrobiaceae bacterium]
MQLRSYLKRVALLAAAGGTVGGFLAPTMSSASAASTAPTAPTAMANLNLALVGSDTVFCVDKAITTRYNKAVANTTGNHVFNVPPIGGVNLGCSKTPLTYAIPGDSTHGRLTFANPAVPPTTGAPPGNGHVCAQPLGQVPKPWEYPDGSGLGITCYTDDNGAGHLAMTRSSRGRASTDPAGLQFWADAMDALSWSSNSSHAPASLNATQIHNILNCNIRTWGKVNGHPNDTTPINVFYPQTGSGTGSFFATLFNGGTYPTPSSCIPASHFVEENTGTQVHAANAFYPYSFALHKAQTDGAETNVTNGFKLGKISGTAPSLTSISEAAAKVNVTGDACNAPKGGQFCATRYVYHTVWHKVPAAEYNAAISLIGVPASGNPGAHSVCSNTYAQQLKRFGFKPLQKAKTGQSTSSNPVPGQSFCRQF